MSMQLMLELLCFLVLCCCRFFIFILFLFFLFFYFFIFFIFFYFFFFFFLYRKFCLGYLIRNETLYLFTYRNPPLMD